MQGLKPRHSWYVCLLLKGRKSHSSTKLKTFLSSREGKLAAAVVREFLEFFELHFTASVFEPETEAVRDADCQHTHYARTQRTHTHPQAASLTHTPTHSQYATSPSSAYDCNVFYPTKNSHRFTMSTVYTLLFCNVILQVNNSPFECSINQRRVVLCTECSTPTPSLC